MVALCMSPTPIINKQTNGGCVIYLVMLNDLIFGAFNSADDAIQSLRTSYCNVGPIRVNENKTAVYGPAYEFYVIKKVVMYDEPTHL